MASLFDAEFAAAAAADYVAMFGEPALYEPREGDPRTISVVIDRGGLANNLGIVDALTLALVIEALDDATLGIAWATVDTGGDHITLPPWPGMTPVRLPLAKRLAQPAGGLCRVSVGKGS